MGLQFSGGEMVSNGDLTVSTTELFLNGETFDGTPIHGSDEVTVDSDDDDDDDDDGNG